MKFTKNPTPLVRLFADAALGFVLVMSAAFAAFAAPGDPDSGFGQGGTILTEFDANAEARIVLAQPDNKIVAAGHIVYPGANPSYDFAVARYNPDGSPDTTFGTGGRTVTSILTRDIVRTGTLQPDGKILIAGSANGDFALVRYNADGTLDTSFDGDGKVVTELAASDSGIRSVLVQPDGKIIAVGGDDNFYIYIVRYNADGTPDASFGSGGKVTTHAADQGVRGRTALLQPDGRIVVGGDYWVNGDSTNSALFRYHADGTPDNSFDGDGLAFYSLSASHDGVSKIFLRPDGKLMSVGTTANIAENRLDYAFGVYNANGTPDTSFGDQGFKILPAVGMIGVSSALVQPDGKIVVAGTKTDPFNGSLRRFHVARFDANAAFDPTFGNGGRYNLPVGYSSTGFSVAIQTDGKLLLAGEGMPVGTRKSHFAVNRLQGGNGAVPTSANITGRVIDDFKQRGFGGATVILTGGSLSAPRYTRTNPFGFYRFHDLPVGAQYTITIATKRSTSHAGSTQIVLNGNDHADDIIYRPVTN